MLQFLVSLLYPKKCVKCRRYGSYICAQCFALISFLDYQICSECQKGSIDGLAHPLCKNKYSMDGMLSAVSYKGIVKKLIYQFKYPPYLSDLKTDLSSLLYEGLIQQPVFMNYIEGKKFVIVSVPLHELRERKRGYNQSGLLAVELGKRFDAAVVNCLKRVKTTKPQYKLSKKERQANIDGAFTIIENLKLKIKNKQVILVDDITTSGITLRECAKILKKGGAGKVLGVTLAHEG